MSLDGRSDLHRAASDAVTTRIVPLVRDILARDQAAHPDPVSDWTTTAYAATDAVLQLVAGDGDVPDLRGPDGRVTIHGANPNGPGHGDLVFAEDDVRTTAYSVISHHISPAIALARMDARDGHDVDWAYLEHRCQMAADTLVTALGQRGAAVPHITGA